VRRRHQIRSHIHRSVAKSQTAQAQISVAGLAINPAPAISKALQMRGFCLEICVVFSAVFSPLVDASAKLRP
jgi:hypothetical protein